MEPMLAKTGEKSDLEKEYIFEPKIDGIRAMCHVNKELKLISRKGRNITSQYPELQFRKNIDASECILDGEIAVYNEDGKPSFNLIQHREQTRNRLQIIFLSEKMPASYIAFDILMKNGQDLKDKPLMERKTELMQTIHEGNGLQLMPFTKNGKKLWREIEKIRLEGVIAKNPKSKYAPGKRTEDWKKIKLLNTIDAIIIGYTSERRAISSLALGIYDGKKIRYIGKVGTGFTEKFLESLSRQIKHSNEPIAEGVNKGIKWAKPELVCEVAFLEFTKDRILRAPSFMRLREDKKPEECTTEQII